MAEKPHDLNGRKSPAEEDGPRCPGLDVYASGNYVAREEHDFHKQVIDSLRPKLLELPGNSAEAAFLGRQALYFGPFADSPAAEIAAARAALPVEKKGLSGLCTHAFNGGAMKFMNTPVFDRLRDSFGISTAVKANFSDTQIANAVGLERSAKIMSDLIASDPDVKTALMVMFPFEWPKFEAGFKGGDTAPRS